MIKVGDTLPEGTLSSSSLQRKPPAAHRPEQFQGQRLDQRQERLPFFGLPGAFRRPALVRNMCPAISNTTRTLKTRGVDEIWCVSVNDAFVMGAWAKDQGTQGKIRMMGDGAATWTKALGLELDLTARNFGSPHEPLFDVCR